MTDQDQGHPTAGRFGVSQKTFLCPLILIIVLDFFI